MLKLVRDGAIGTIVIDRAEKKNAITKAMWQAFPGLIAEIEQDAAIRVVLVTGNGGIFAAGADIGEFDEVYATRASAEDYMAQIARAQRAIASCTKPTIARVSGLCVGAGCGIALSCDIRFGDSTARFGITPAKLGMIYSLVDTKRLVDAVGVPAAHDLLLSGRLADADEAMRIGLVNRLFPSDRLIAETHAFALTIADNAPSSLAGIKAILSMIRAGASAETPESHGLFFDILDGPDFAEGVAAFRAKRKPNY